ncbi:phospholipid phosphatase 3-like isoform X1 [Thamnophis elegans]|uniref:phospholipid phosphatase 3-like isoform X1 n=1 Tax=Thamnophis elegans TaxID=35005 RepID=UPI0013769FAE|nr:phospholipid phosphatase 3-like isoform X1 [Thamnophis elegans]XP_032066922.1 phospholipid phosphatase 3-like isoform X1 [Thamnophis elegans]XP_032066924.1 phospholipid phosphatase 3-like isoform X1 [Thamnophis elegans]XP_032066925.1 phospholipid phosphatase 3-like isoform X1 [Thamnophis elegans]
MQNHHHQALQPLQWQRGHRELRVTAGSPAIQSAALAPLRRRKTLVAVDVVCLLVVSVPFFICEFGLVSPVHRGFFCNDSSISYPLKHPETITDTVLISAGTLIAFLAITVGEIFHVRRLPHRSCSTISNPYVSALYKEIGAFLFGCCVGQSLTNMAKIAVGRLRPHFLAVCQPNFTHIVCSAGYLEDYVCTGSRSKEQEARKSFYSGHASFAMYTTMYLVFYLQARFTWRGARLLRPLVQFVLLMLALYTGLTRISDYRHHPSDVIVGLLQGALVAYWVVSYNLCLSLCLTLFCLSRVRRN